MKTHVRFGDTPTTQSSSYFHKRVKMYVALSDIAFGGLVIVFVVALAMYCGYQIGSRDTSVNGITPGTNYVHSELKGGKGE